MPSPLPGMDPYLEHPDSWPNFHHRLITAIAISLAPQLRPKYRVAVEKAIYPVQTADSGVELAVQPAHNLSGDRPQTGTATALGQPILINLPMPEVIRQGYLEIREVATGEVVTVIEVLSPANKRPEGGRHIYEAKRQAILSSPINLVEIDLLRQWLPIVRLPKMLQTHYRILVSASATRPQASLYAFNLQETIPTFPIPLQPEDSEPILNLQSLLADIYDHPATT